MSPRGGPRPGSGPKRRRVAPSRPLTVRLEPEVVAEAEEWAAARSMPRARALARLVERGLRPETAVVEDRLAQELRAEGRRPRRRTTIPSR
jgi:hypothetical protein